MLRAFLHTFTWLAIVLGTIATPVTIYVVLNGSVHDGSIPHSGLWQQLFGNGN